MILGDLIKICLTSLAAGVIIAITVVLLAIIVYLVAGVISSIIQTFKEVQARNRAKMLLHILNKLAKDTRPVSEKK